MFRNCLVCTDLNDGLQRFVDFVPDLAAGGLKRIVFLHCLSVWADEKMVGVDERKLADARAKLSRALDSVPEGVEVEIEVHFGQLKDAIARWVNARAIEVIVMGTPIDLGVDARIFGSNALEVAKITSTPILVFRPQLLSIFTREELSLRCRHLWREILIPYDDSPAARHKIERMKALSLQHPDAKPSLFRLVWAIESGRSPELDRLHFEEAERKLQAVKADLTAAGFAVEVEVRSGDPLLEVLDAALNDDISAIAISSNSRNLLQAWTIPSLAKEFLSRSWFPLLYFPPEE